jgi:hypothetical protein
MVVLAGAARVPVVGAGEQRASMARIKCFLLVGVFAAGLCLGTGADAMSGAQKYNGTHVSDAR